MNAMGNKESVPLCVDADGTLLRTDLLWEGLCSLLRTRPLRMLLAPLWLCRGVPYLKARLAREGRLDFDTLPMNSALVEWARAEAATRPVWLVSGAHQSLVRRLASRLGFFAGAAGTRKGRNLTGARKAVWLAEKFGARGFDYAGDSRADLPAWRVAREAVVADGAGLQRRAARVAQVGRIFPAHGRRAHAWIQALRVLQWLKNLVVFAPALTSHQVLDPAIMFPCAIGMACFCLLASGLYLLNDLVDLEFDRRHPDKCGRPLASGRIRLSSAAAAAPLLVAAAGALSMALPTGFRWVLLLYGALSAAYSLRLKRVVLLDVLVLAVLFLLRIVAGGWAGGLGVSSWLMGFAVFLFLSLALAKRYAELRAMQAANRGSAAGRGYATADIEEVGLLGVGTGLLSVFIVALYIGSAEAARSYSERHLLWIACLVLFFWIGRLWLINHRGELHEDPVRFVAHDTASHIAAAVALAALYFAS